MGYGMLTGCIGLGAVFGAILLPRLRQRYSADAIVTAAALAFAVTLLAMAWVHQLWPLVLNLLLGGIAWTSTTSCLNIAVQMSVPAWVQARSSVPQSVRQLPYSGQLRCWSLRPPAPRPRFRPPDHLGTPFDKFPAIARRFPLMADAALDHSPGRLAHALSRSVPQVMIESKPEDGPVLITVTFRVDPALAAEFIRAAHQLGRVRRRDGAIRWALFRDPFDPGRYEETYVVESWLERRRLIERFTVADNAIRNRVLSFHIGECPPYVSRMVLAIPSQQTPV